MGVTEGEDPQFPNRYAGGMMSKSYDSLASGTISSTCRQVPNTALGKVCECGQDDARFLAGVGSCPDYLLSAPHLQNESPVAANAGEQSKTFSYFWDACYCQIPPNRKPYPIDSGRISIVERTNRSRSGPLCLDLKMPLGPLGAKGGAGCNYVTGVHDTVTSLQQPNFLEQQFVAGSSET